MNPYLKKVIIQDAKKHLGLDIDIGVYAERLLVRLPGQFLEWNDATHFVTWLKSECDLEVGDFWQNGEFSIEIIKSGETS